MLSFESDYTEGAHPNILRQLMATNMDQEPGYGFDEFSQLAKERIQKALGHPEAQVEFLTGGTQTNQVVIDAMLTQYQGVIAAETGHINVHEAGAIEATGHKVLALPAKDAKLDAQTVTNTFRPSNRTRIGTTWFSQEWFILPTQQNSGPCTQGRN